MEGVSSTGLQEVVVQSTIKHATAQVAKTTVGSITANFAKGLVESGINTLVGALNVVIHPIETAKQVGSLIDKSSTFEGRLMLGLNLGISALNTYNNFKSGNADVKANIAGNLVGDIAQLFIGTGEVKAASYAMEASNFERQMLKFAQNAEKAELGAAKGVRNGHLAGKVHPKTGVPFDNAGFPDFSGNLYKGGLNDVLIKPTGNRVADFTAANKAAGYSSTPKGFTWHHHQTTGRMQLVETGVHSQTGHTGGFSLWKY